jgi:hypothetical protein
MQGSYYALTDNSLGLVLPPGHRSQLLFGDTGERFDVGNFNGRCAAAGLGD